MNNLCLACRVCYLMSVFQISFFFFYLSFSINFHGLSNLLHKNILTFVAINYHMSKHDINARDEKTIT